jgi:ribosomal protein S18 acetylase RimI-like enzyme
VSETTIRAARPTDAAQLGLVLVSVVEAGASVGFLRPLGIEEASAYWVEHLADAHTRTLVAEADDTVVGTVSLVLAGRPNGRHRAEVAKLLVRTDAQGAGAGRALLRAAEDLARAEGRRTLVLDTVSGSPAQRLYESEGWAVVGEIPDYADLPDGTPSPTTILTKRLG